MADIPPLPPGFKLDAAPAAGGVPPLPPGFKLDAPAAAAAPAKEPGLVDKALGWGEAALTGLSTIPAAVEGAAAGLGGLTAQAVRGEIGSPEGAARVQQGISDKMGARIYQPRTESGREAVQTAGRVFDESKLGGLGPSEALALGSTSPRAAAAQAGKTLAPEIGAVKAIPGKVADLVTPKPAKEVAALAKKAQDMGIELRPDMLSDNRIARSIGEALEQVPMSGSKKDQRQIAFNSALTKIVGGDTRAKRLTPDVFDRAMTQSGEKIGEIAKQTPIRVDPELQQKFMARVAEAGKFETPDVAHVVKNYVTELGSLTGPDGVIPGEAFRKMNSKIGRQARSTSNGDLKNALHELQQDMHDALEKNIASPERLAELKDARFRYAMGKIIEPLVAKAKGGDISPAGLMAAVTSDKAKKSMMARGRGGEIGDLAKIGQAFLKEPGSSGTAERNLAYGLIGDTAAIARDALIYPAANAYNRLGPKLTKRALSVRDVDPQAQRPWNLGQP